MENKKLTKEEIETKKYSYLRLSMEEKSDYDLACAFLEINYKNIKHIPPNLKFYKELVIKAININAQAYIEIHSKALKDNDDVIEALINKSPNLYESMTKIAKSKNKTILKLISKDGFMYRYIPHEKKNDLNLIKEIIKIKPSLYNSIESVFKSDEDILSILISSSPSSYKIVPEKIRNLKKLDSIADLALSLDVENISYVPYEKRINVEAWISVFNNNKRLIYSQIPAEIINNDDLIKSAIKNYKIDIIENISEEKLEMYKFEILDSLSYCFKNQQLNNLTKESQLWSILKRMSSLEGLKTIFEKYGETFIDKKNYLRDNYGCELVDELSSQLEKIALDKQLMSKNDNNEKRRVKLKF